jgi:dienelactone hydrolase
MLVVLSLLLAVLLSSASATPAWTAPNPPHTAGETAAGSGRPQPTGLSDPGPYQAGWQKVTVTRPDSTTFDAWLFYPALSNGQNAPYDGSGAPYPTISFGHGYRMDPLNYQSTLEHLATWGYFVMATESYTGLSPNYQLYADDLRYCLTHLETENADNGSWLYQQVDIGHFGMAGHSMGGSASILATAADPRVKALVALAAAELSPSAIAAMATITVPVCLASGDEDGFLPLENHTALIYANGNPPRQFPLILGGCHCGFMDFDFNGCDSGSLPRSTQLAITRRLLTAYFHLYLQGDQTIWRQVWGPEKGVDPLVLTEVDSGIGLDPETQTGEAVMGTVISYTLTLTNVGPLANSYALFTEDNAWFTTFPVSQTTTLNSGESQDLLVAVHVPAAPASGEDMALVSARSDLDGGTRQYITMTPLVLWSSRTVASGEPYQADPEGP